MTLYSKPKGSKPTTHGQPLNLPPQVFSKLHQEERLLKEQLAVLKRDMYYDIISTVQKQQVAGRKMKLLERRFKRDKERTELIRRTISAPPLAQRQATSRQAISFSTRWKSSSSSTTSRPTTCLQRPTRRWSTVEYFRDLLRPSVLVSKGVDGGDDIQWAESFNRSSDPEPITTVSSTLASRRVHKVPHNRPESRAFTPSQWVSVNSPSDMVPEEPKENQSLLTVTTVLQGRPTSTQFRSPR